MHLVQRVAAVVLTLGLSAGLVGCGFHLKGSYPTATPLVYNKPVMPMMPMYFVS